MEDVKYTEDGHEVIVVREVEGGFLVSHVYDYRDFGSDEDYFEADNNLVFYEKIFEKAPTRKLCEEIAELEQQKESLELSVAQLKQQAWSAKQLAGKVSEFPILKMLHDYLTDNWTHRVDLKYLEISARGSIFNSKKITVSNLHNNWSIRLHDSDYNSDYDRHIVVFQSEQEAKDFARSKAEKRIRDAAEGNYPSSQGVQSIWMDFHYAIREDKELQSVFKEVKDKITETENEKMRKRVEQELKEAQEKLAKLSAQ